jgi:hypothetical protein
MLAFSLLSRSHQTTVRIAARKAVGRGKDSPAFSQRALVSRGKSFERKSLGNEAGLRRVGREAAETGRNAIERQGGRCYTPAALKVAAGLPPCP